MGSPPYGIRDIRVSLAIAIAVVAVSADAIVLIHPPETQEDSFQVTVTGVTSMFIDPAFYIMEHLELLDDPSSVDWSKLDMDIDSVDAYTCVHNYLTQHVGMSEDRVQALVERLTA